MAYAIETKKLTKYYGKARGIVDVDISVEEGEIFGFIDHVDGNRRGEALADPHLQTDRDNDLALDTGLAIRNLTFHLVRKDGTVGQFVGIGVEDEVYPKYVGVFALDLATNCTRQILNVHLKAPFKELKM